MGWKIIYVWCPQTIEAHIRERKLSKKPGVPRNDEYDEFGLLERRRIRIPLINKDKGRFLRGCSYKPG